MKTRKTGIMICIFFVVLSAAGYFAFQKYPKKSEEKVYAQKVSKIAGYKDQLNRFPGVVESKGTEEFHLDSEKKILEIFVTQGQKVEAGEALYKYDDSQTKNSISSAQLEVEGIQQSAAILKKEIKELEEQLKQNTEEESYKIRSDISDKQMEIKQYEYDIQAKQNEIANLKKELEQSVIKTRIGGIVKNINLNATGQSEQSEAFLSIVQDENYVVKGVIDEISIDRLQENTPVIIRSRVNKDQFWKGTVSEIKRNQEKEKDKDQESSQSGQEKASRYPFYVILDESESLILGQHVFIEPDVGQEEKKEGIWINSGFIIQEKDGSSYVWSVEKGKIVKKKIETGQIDEETDRIEICAGLTKKDYIYWPDPSLKVGQKVKIDKK